LTTDITNTSFFSPESNARCPVVANSLKILKGNFR
jgi:hypothetical protein